MAKYGEGVISVYDAPHDGEFEHKNLTGRTVTVGGRTIPLVRETDVVVIGGGPGGTSAAVAAARAGARVLLLERYGHLGGMATGGLVNIIPNLGDIEGKQWIGGFCQELIDRLKARGAADFPPPDQWGRGDPALVRKYEKANMVHFYIRRNGAGEKVVLYTAVIDPEVGKQELADMVLESGCDLLLHCTCSGPIVEGNAVKGVVLETKSGPQAVLAKVVIDSTGDGDLLRDLDTPLDEVMLPNTRIAQFGWVFWLANVDLDAFDAFAEAEPEKWKEIMQKIRDEGGRPFFSRGLLEHQKGVVWIHRLIGSLHQTEPEEMTYIDTSARRTAVRSWELMKRYVPGFENSFIMLSAPQLGTSGGRRIVGEYYLTEDDLERAEPFEDTIAVFADNDRGDSSVAHTHTYIPYRSLLPVGVDGLLVACRAFSSDYMFQEYFNLIPHCMCFGQAAGAAAALAVKHGIEPRDVPYAELKEELLRHGAILP